MKLFAEEFKTPMSVKKLDKKYKKGKISFEEWERGYLVHLFFLLYSFKLDRERAQERLEEQLEKFKENGQKTDLQLAFSTWKDPKASNEDVINALLTVGTYKILDEMNSGHYYTLTWMSDSYVTFASNFHMSLQEEYKKTQGFYDEATLYGRPFLRWLNDESIQRDGLYRYFETHEKKKAVAVEKTKEAKLLTPGEAHDLICIYVKLVLESTERYMREHGIDNRYDILCDLDEFKKLDCFTEDMLFVNPDGTLAERDIHLFNRFDARFDLNSVPSISEYKKSRALNSCQEGAV